MWLMGLWRHTGSKYITIMWPSMYHDHKVSISGLRLRYGRSQWGKSRRLLSVCSHKIDPDRGWWFLHDVGEKPQVSFPSRQMGRQVAMSCGTAGLHVVGYIRWWVQMQALRSGHTWTFLPFSKCLLRVLLLSEINEMSSFHPSILVKPII